MLIESARKNEHRWWWIPVSLLLALALLVVPLPDAIGVWRPDWVALGIVYWAIYEPRRVGVVVGWLCGLALDVMQFTLLGQQALSLAIVAFVANRYHVEFAKMPPLQQTLAVFALLLFDTVFVAFIQAFVFQSGFDIKTIAPTVSALILWPMVTLAMRNLGRRDDMF